MKDYRFSVLISVYKNDNPLFFSEALESIIKQTLPPDEIVLVVDGPISKELESIIKEKKEKFYSLKPIFLKENVGQSLALNIGLQECIYDIVARMDSDDISLENRFEKQIKFLKENNVEVISAYTQDFSTKNGNLGIRKIPENFQDVKKFFKRRSPVNHGVCMYKKSFILSVGAYKNYIQMQDYILWGDVIKNKGTILNIPEVLLKVRVDDNYSRKNNLAYFKEEIKVQKYFYKLGLINIKDVFLNIFFRIFPRLLPTVVIKNIYQKVLRG